MKKVMLILGAAPSAVKELEEAIALIDGTASYEIMAIGLDAVATTPRRIAYVATYHPDDIEGIYQRRGDMDGNVDFKVIGHMTNPGIHVVIEYKQHSGSSAMLGAQGAILEGYEKIILCGCPLSDGPYKAFQDGWKVREELLRGKVKSMSGWTREFLGGPTQEWLMND